MNKWLLSAALSLALVACDDAQLPEPDYDNRITELEIEVTDKDGSKTRSKIIPTPNRIELPAPYETPVGVKLARVVGWQEGQMPTAPAGFTVQKYAGGLNYPRWIYQLPNGDVLVAQARTTSMPSTDAAAQDMSEEEIAAALEMAKQSKMWGDSANRITLFRDTDGDGLPDEQHTFLENLNQPLGMALVGDQFFVANTDGVMVFPYQDGNTSITTEGRQIIDLPAGGYNNHWTRNLLVGLEQERLYISIGSATNVDEDGSEEPGRARIISINLDGSDKRVHGTGLRNPVGMDWEPQTGILWTAVNERDLLGDDLVPDYMTSVRPGGFYGWPWWYWGENVDPRHAGKTPEIEAPILTPDMPLGAHTASLGLVFYTGETFPNAYQGSAFVGQHGSWNRTEFSGYKVVYVPFENGVPSSGMQDFLTGFIGDAEAREVFGRPAGVTVLQDGSLLVADDAGDTIWRVIYTGD